MLILADMRCKVARDATNTDFKLSPVVMTGDRQLAEIADGIIARKSPHWGPLSGLPQCDKHDLPELSGPDLEGSSLCEVRSRRDLDQCAVDALEGTPRSTTLHGFHAVWTGSRSRPSAHRRWKPPAFRGSGTSSLAFASGTRRSGDGENFANLPPLDEASVTPPAGAQARQHTVDGELIFIFARRISGYGDLPITIGTYFQARLVDAPVQLFYWGLAIAIAVLGVSLIAAALMAGAISGPIRRAARGATGIAELDFDQVEPLAPSRVREINDLAQSFNAMLDGLRAFGRYVPRTLVTRLVKEGRIGARTEERELAIMFTDIVGFTAACEKMSAGEVAEFINQHLALVAACVEQEGGTIDKFIGDAVMAFWGAPSRAENPAASACRAAIAVQLAIAGDNERRIAKGLEPVRIRIGIHMGSVVVGDIGAPNRINYTIVGDAVNATQRLEGLGKVIDPEAEFDYPGQPYDF